MKVVIKLVGIFRIGRFKETIREYPAAVTVMDVIAEHGISLPLLGVVLINGIHADVKDSLHDGDSICFLPLIDGG